MRLSLTDKMVLAELLAEIDAMWLSPVPYTTGAGPILRDSTIRGVIHRRRDYRLSGVAYQRGGDVAERKRAERRIRSLAAKGVFQIVATTAGRRIGVKLTPSGETLARHLCGVPTIDEAWPTLRRVGSLIDGGCFARSPCDGQAWVPETAIAQAEYGQGGSLQRFYNVDVTMLPLRIAGLAVDTVTMWGAVWYALTAVGQFAANGKPPQRPAGLPRRNDDCALAYQTLLDDRLLERLSWRPLMPQDLYVPMLPASAITQRPWQEING